MKEIMEREILIANTRTQKRSKINSTATTLAELKAELSAAGIDYSGMTFTEGISKTQLLDDATQLPSNVLYKGQPTNNLVILLTNTKKHIASGAGTRQEAYAAIKAQGLQEEVKKRFGRNFTQVPTDDLWDFLISNTKVEIPSALPEEEGEEEVEEPVNENSTEEAEEEIGEVDNTTAEVFGSALCELVFRQLCIYTSLEAISSVDLKHLKDAIGKLEEDVKQDERNKFGTPEPVSTSDGSINDDDIDDMINDIL